MLVVTWFSKAFHPGAWLGLKSLELVHGVGSHDWSTCKMSMELVPCEGENFLTEGMAAARSAEQSCSVLCHCKHQCFSSKL